MERETEMEGVGITHTWMHGRKSGGTNLPAAGAGVTGWLKSKCSDTGEGAVKSLSIVSNSRGKF